MLVTQLIWVFQKLLDKTALLACVWWPNLAVNVKHFVAGSQVCQHTKDIKQCPAGLLQWLPVSDGKFDTCTIDFMTDLPEVDGYNALMVVVDKFGKLSRLVPCRLGEGQLTAHHVVYLFFDSWVGLFGVPQYVIHDHDARFTAAFWKVFQNMLGTPMLFSSTYHPRLMV